MADEQFHLVSNYAPTGDQPQAIEQLVEGVERGDRCQTLLGVTGSGKTFTMANVIARCNRPTLVLAHNKTLAAQLCTECLLGHARLGVSHGGGTVAVDGAKVAAIKR